MANIFANYKSFIENNAPLFESIEGMKSILIDEIEYKNFKEAILENIENADVVGDLLDRQREVILEDANSTLTSPEAIAFSVASLPMVTMVYNTPTLSNDGTVIYNMKTPTATVPVLEWVAKIIDVDGTVNEVKFPTATDAVRPGIKEITQSNQFFNIYSVLGITKDDFRISKRGLMLTGVKVTETDSGGNTIEHDNVVYAAVDSRGHFSVDYSITAADGVEVKFRATGTINASSGDVTWSNVIVENASTSTFETNEVTIKVRVVGNGINKAIVKVEPLNTAVDINADNAEKFEIENIVEVIQDWKSLYNVDILAQLTDMVKLQIELNRDYDIADILKAEEQNAIAAGLSTTLDFASLPSVYYENPRAVLSSIVPKIMIVRERIYRLTRRWADIIATGTDMAALLKSIQDFAINLPDGKGEFGQAGFGIAEFAKMKIIGSNAIDNNTLYMWKKGSNAGDATLLTAVYKPLVIVEETTNSKRRLFVESRYSVELLRSNSVGVIKIENYQGFLA